MEADRQQEIARALDNVLNEGDEFVVRRHDGEIDVEAIEEADLRPFSDENPQLYGHLLAVSEVLSDAGSSFVLFTLLTMGGICLMVHMDWIETFLGIDVEKLQSIWVYAFALVASFFAAGQVGLWFEWAAYRRHRSELIQSIRDAGISRWHLLARIAHHKELSNVVDKLKTDPRGWDNGPFRD